MLKSLFICFFRINRYSITYTHNMYKTSYLYNDSVKCIISEFITYYYTIDISIDTTSSLVLLSKLEYKKKAIRLRAAIADWTNRYAMKHYKRYNNENLVQILEEGFEDPCTVIFFEKELSIDNMLLKYPFNRERDIRSIKKESDLLLKAVMTLVELNNKDLKLMIGILIENILCLSEKIQEILSYRIDWSALGGNLQKLGKASKRELEKNVYIEINWSKTTELNIDSVLRSLIEQNNYRFILFGDLEFFITVEIIQKLNYQKA